MGTPTKTNEASAPEREEEFVRALRTHFSAAVSFREQGQLEQASREEGEAADLLDQLTRRVAGRFERYARAAFQAGPKDLASDAVQEMFATLCERVKNLSPKQAIWGDRFNYCLRLLQFDAVEAVRTRNGLDSKGRRQTPQGGSVVSLDDPTGFGGDDDPLTIGDQIADPTSGDQFELGDRFRRALGPRLVTQLLSELPQNQRPIFVDRMNRISWEETARRAGVSVSTAQDRFEKARATLLRILSGGLSKERLR